MEKVKPEKIFVAWTTGPGIIPTLLGMVPMGTAAGDVETDERWPSTRVTRLQDYVEAVAESYVLRHHQEHHP